MKIQLKTDIRGEFCQIQIDKEMTIEEIINEYCDKLSYTVLAAKINNKIVELNERVTEDCKLELLDMRTQAANLIYQYSVSLIYLKAVQDVMENVTVEIQHSLNKGLYTEIKTFKPVTLAQVNAIEKRMRQIVKEDIPIIKEVTTREEGIDRLVDTGMREKARILLHSGVDYAKFYSLSGYINFFYGLMVPSTRYIQYFELKKYKRGVLLRFPHPSNPNKIPEYVDEKKLYNAFGEAKKWGELMEVSFVADLNQKVQDGSYKELIQLSEALNEKRIAEIADMITKKQRRIILIAGPSSSGKTTFARRLCIQLRVNGLKPLYLGTDDYFVERSETPLDENGEPNFEDLESIDIKLFNDNMNDLLDGKDVDIPTFEFIEGTKVFGKRITKINSTQPIVIEGIHALNEGLTPFIQDDEKFRIYISPLTQLNIDDHNRIPTTDARMLRRMVRDYLYRNHSAQGTISSWPKVRKGEDKNIFPYSGAADVLFNSVHIYELAVLKKYAEPLLQDIKPDEPEYSEAVRMLKFLKFFETIEDDSVIVNNSIIREFIGGSIFVE